MSETKRKCEQVLEAGHYDEHRVWIPDKVCRGYVHRRHYDNGLWVIESCDNPRCHYLRTYRLTEWRNRLGILDMLHKMPDSILPDEVDETVDLKSNGFKELKFLYYRKSVDGTTVFPRTKEMKVRQNLLKARKAQQQNTKRLIDQQNIGFQQFMKGGEQ